MFNKIFLLFIMHLSVTSLAAMPSSYAQFKVIANVYNSKNQLVIVSEQNHYDVCVYITYLVRVKMKSGNEANGVETKFNEVCVPLITNNRGHFESADIAIEMKNKNQTAMSVTLNNWNIRGEQFDNNPTEPKSNFPIEFTSTQNNPNEDIYLLTATVVLP